MRGLGFAMVAALCAAGCIVVPTVAHTPLQTEHRGSIGEQDFRALEPGSTTREEVLLRLGEPDVRLDDDRAFGFIWDEAWLFFAAGGYGSAVAGEAARHLAVMVRFDDAGRLARKELVVQPRMQTDATWYHRIEEWR